MTADTPGALAVHQRARDFVRFALALAATGHEQSARAAFASRWPQSKSLDLIARSAVAAGTTTDADWGEPLSELNQLGAAFIEVTRAKSALGQMNGLRRIPFNVKVPRQLDVSQPTWTGEGQASRFTSLSFDSIQFMFAKLTALVAISKELAALGNPEVESLVSNDLGKAIAAMVDQDFLDPTNAGDDISPASITYGAPSVAATGTNADAFRSDVRALVEQMHTAGCKFIMPHWVMSPAMRISLALLDGGLLRNGVLAEIPVTVTEAAIADGNSPDDQRLFLVDASEVMLADGGLEVGISNHATVQLDDAPDSPPTASTTQISLWQNNLVGLKVQRYIRWEKRHGCAAGYITGAAYGR